jgi:hypothetical protein
VDGQVDEIMSACPSTKPGLFHGVAKAKSNAVGKSDYEV